MNVLFYFIYLWLIFIASTVECLVRDLENNPNAFQLWDEFATLSESFGLYKGGGGGASAYDKSIFNSIYNGDSEIKRSTIKSQTCASQPRLGILAAGHPSRVIEMLLKEKNCKSGCDGLISRFIFSVPNAMRKSLRDLAIIPVNSFTLKHLFLMVYFINKNAARTKETKTHFHFSEAAFDLLNSCFDEYNTVASKYQLTNGFIS